MSYTAWPLITDIQEVCTGMGKTLGTTFSTTYIQSIIDAAVRTFQTKTRRQFIPTAGTRYYSGNNTGELEIDEYTTIHSVSLVGFVGLTPGLEFTEIFEITDNEYPKTKIGVYRGTMPALYRLVLDRFPVGRRNIQVSADWGYGVTIPEDIWVAIRYQAAGLLLNQAAYKTAGYLIKWTEADVSEVRNYMDPFKFYKAPVGMKELISMYKKPSGIQFRNQYRQLV